MGFLRVIEVLEDVAFALVEPVVNTVLNPGGPISSGTVTVTPASMAGIYPGAILIAGYGLGSEEAVMVLSVTASTFTAVFVNAHLATDSVLGTTFPSGQTDHPLYTQTEMLGYMADVQQDFLMRVRPIYKTLGSALLTNKVLYPNPADAIRIERISLAGIELFNVAQTDLDWSDPGWMHSTVPPNPQYWYQDGVKLSYGIAPVIQRNDTVELMYSQNSGETVGMLDSLLVPDPMTFILKYGILARAWSKDGEARDLIRAKFCQQWYELFCIVSAKFLSGVNGRMKSADETVEPLVAQMGK